MPSEADLINTALGRVGLARVNDITDGTVSANWCLAFYPVVRRALLRGGNWNFAMTRVQLAVEGVAPVFEYTMAFTLPASLLRIVEFNGTNIVTPVENPYYWMNVPGLYTIEGRSLLTNDTQAYIRFIQDITDPQIMDALFFDVCSLTLAAELASAVRHDFRMRASLLEEVRMVKLPLAQSVDGQEGTEAVQSVPNLIWGR